MTYPAGTLGAQFQENPGKGFPISSSMSEYLLVKLVANVLTLCAKDTAQDWIGTTMESRLLSILQIMPVRFPGAGSAIMTMAATENIDPGAIVYKQAGGKIGLGSTGSIAVGIALTSGGVAGAWIEVLPY